MGTILSRSRLSACLLPILFIITLVTSSSAQGLFGMGFPGMPSVGGFAAGPAGYGEKADPGIAAPTLYVGWMEDRRGASYQLSGIFLGVDSFDLNHQYPLRGTWFGLSETVTFSERLRAIASGWLLAQANNTHTSELEGSPDDLGSFEWERTPTKWYYVDGLLSYRCTEGLTALAGFRYDYYTSHFRQLNVPVPDTGDVIINNYIPLIGLQWSYLSANTNLVFRTVGFPVIFGNYKLIELFNGDPFEARGNFKNGYFLEAFTEYSRTFGAAGVGVFARWNLAHTESNTRGEFPDTGTSTFRLGLQRSSWTLGGSFNLAFNMPL